MSTSPDPTAGPAAGQAVTLLSQWLARHVADDAVRRELADLPLDSLSLEQRELVEELRAALDAGDSPRGDLEMLVRETLEALALG